MKIDNDNCPQCGLGNVYQEQPGNTLWLCADCGFEFNTVADAETDSASSVVKDAFGNVLNDGDSVVLVKELKVKGSAITLKLGTKVRNIKLKPDNGDHNVDCKVEGVAMMLKSEFLKKAN